MGRGERASFPARHVHSATLWPRCPMGTGAKLQSATPTPHLRKGCASSSKLVCPYFGQAGSNSGTNKVHLSPRFFSAEAGETGKGLLPRLVKGLCYQQYCNSLMSGQVIEVSRRPQTTLELEIREPMIHRGTGKRTARAINQIPWTVTGPFSSAPVIRRPVS